jgi:Uma2 family endonuclease
MVDTLALPTGLPTMLRFRPLYDMTPEEFYEFCRQNPDMRAELTAQGEVVFMSPSGGASGARNLLVAGALWQWAEKSDGVAFDSSAGFILPNNAIRSPDASWVRRERLAKLSAEDYERFLPICPDFVVEIASPSDRMADLQAKLEEYMANGAQLGWLIDPPTRSITVYRPDETPQLLTAADSITADPVLPGFSLELRPVWQPFDR